VSKEQGTLDAFLLLSSLVLLSLSNSSDPPNRKLYKERVSSLLGEHRKRKGEIKGLRYKRSRNEDEGKERCMRSGNEWTYVGGSMSGGAAVDKSMRRWEGNGCAGERRREGTAGEKGEVEARRMEKKGRRRRTI
jgi:hypothetical protein